MQPVTVELQSHTRGDTWEGLLIGPILINEAQPEYPLAQCRLYFRNEKGVLAYKLKSTLGEEEEGGDLVIVDANTWVIEAPEQLLPLKAGVYNWDFETIDSNGVVRTLYKGTFTITQDYSYDD